MLLDRPRHQQTRRRDPRHRRPDQVHHRRRRRRRDHGRPRPDTGIDLLLGVGGTPEGIIAACAMKCLDGVIQGRLWPNDDEERQRALDAGHDLDPDHVLQHRRPGHRRRRVLRGDRDHRRRADEGRPLPRRRRQHALAGDALAQRHDPVDHLRPPAAEAARPTPPSTSSTERR